VPIPVGQILQRNSASFQRGALVIPARAGLNLSMAADWTIGVFAKITALGNSQFLFDGRHNSGSGAQFIVFSDGTLHCGTQDDGGNWLKFESAVGEIKPDGRWILFVARHSGGNLASYYCPVSGAAIQAATLNEYSGWGITNKDIYIGDSGAGVTLRNPQNKIAGVFVNNGYGATSADVEAIAKGYPVDRVLGGTLNTLFDFSTNKRSNITGDATDIVDIVGGVTYDDDHPFRSTKLRPLFWLPQSGGGTQVSSSILCSIESQQTAKQLISSMIENLTHAGVQLGALIESMQSLLRAHLSGAESVSSVSRGSSAWYESLLAVSRGSTVHWGAKAALLTSSLSSLESAQELLMSRSSLFHSSSPVSSMEASATESIAQIIQLLLTQYESGGVASTPVSMAVAVAIEAVQGIRRAPLTDLLLGASVSALGASPIEMLHRLGAAGLSPFEVMSMLALSSGVSFESDGTVVVANYHDLELLLSNSENLEAFLSIDFNIH